MAARDTSAGSGPAGRGDAPGEDGFVLLEAVISIALLSIIMAALTTFSITTINSTGYQRQRQAAVQVANSTLDTLRAMPGSGLASGRTAAATQSQFDSAPAAVTPWLTTMTRMSDSSGATVPQLAMSSTTTLNNTVFTATNYLGSCTVSRTTVSGNACGTTSLSDPVSYTRAVVAVTWSGSRCPSNLCSLVTATLISPRSDPLFSTRQRPPSAPSVANPGTLLSWVGQTVSFQFATDTGTGVDPETWSATGLPAGLSISPSGLVTGQPTTLGTSTVTVRVVDAFRRAATRAVTWQVVNPLSGLTTPFTTTAGATITPQALPWNCAGSTCTYTLSGAPAGIGLSTTATGSPSASVTVTAQTGTMYLVGSTGTAAAPRSGDYAAAVKATSPTDYWPLGERSGTTGADAVASNPLIHSSGVTVGAPGAVLANADAAAGYNGASTGYSVSTVASKGPQTFSESLWFSTTTTAGGKLLGFGNSTGATSSKYDRHIYLDNGGHLVFGVYNGGAKTVATTGSYNDGKWHQVVGTLSPTAGLTLYVDGGAEVVAEPTFKTAETNDSGYWHIGGDNLSTTWPGSRSSSFFAGTIDEVSIHPTALTADQVAQLYRAATAAPYALSIAATATNSSGATSSGPATTAAWTVNPPPSIAGITTPFTTTAGVAVTDQALTYSCPSAACSFALTGVPDGIGLATTRGGSTSATVAVTSTSGTLYLGGTPSSSSAPGASTYPGVVAGQGPTDYWRLGERSGTDGADSVTSGPNPLVHSSGVTVGTAGAVPTNADAGATYNGTSTGLSATTTRVTAPSVFSESLWFSTTSTTGGKLFGFGNLASGTSGNYDRHVWMDNAGHVSFGVYNGQTNTVTTGGTYNDGKWHQVVGTLSGSGQFLYVDGALVGSTTATSAESNTGYWRIGGDNLGGWPSAGSSQWYSGSIDDVAVYPSALSATQVAAQWAAGTGTSTAYPPAASSTDTSTTTAGSGTTGTWTVVAPSTVGGLQPVKTLSGSNPGDQVITYGCPSSSCTLTLTGAPAGVGLTTTATGTPASTGTSVVTVTGTTGAVYLRGPVSATAAAGTYTLAVTPMDTITGAAGTAATATWTVGTPPTVSGVAALTTKQGAAASQKLSWTCPSGSCTFSVTGAPDGIGLTTGDSGTPTPSVTVSGQSGTIYLRGTVSLQAATQGYPVTVSSTDTPTGQNGGSSTGTWTVGAAPTVAGLKTPFTVTAGGTLSGSGSTATAAQKLTYTCPSGSCSLAVSGAPSGIGLATSDTGSVQSPLAVTAASGSVYLRGTVASNAATGPYTVTVTPSDTVAPTTTGAANTASWTVNAPPSAGSVPNARATKGQSSPYTSALTWTCPSGTCTLTLGGTAGIGLGLTTDSSATSGTASLTVTGTSGTYYLRGTVSGATGSYALTVTPTDGVWSIAGPASGTTLKVDQPTASGLSALTTTQGATVTSQKLTVTCPSGSCSVAVSGAPTGIGLDTDDSGSVQSSLTVSGTSATVYVRGTVDTSAVAKAYAVSVTVTDTTANVAGPANTATWTVQAVPTVSGLNGPYSYAKNTTLSGSMSYTCPTSNCTITLTGAPSGWGLSTSSGGTYASSVTVTGTSGTVYIRGNTGTTVKTYTLYSTPVDNTTGVTGTADTFALTVTN